jgi:adenylate kinase
MIILMGNPGSGKSTQGQLLADRQKIRWVSMSDILRRNVHDEQSLTKMHTGELLSDTAVFDALSKGLTELSDKPELVLDGFPRSLAQSKWLLKQVAAGKITVSAVINLVIDKKAVAKRLLKRGRIDDDLAKIEKRLKIYEKTYSPITQTLKDNQITILEINGDQTPQAIHEDILKSLHSIGIEA